MLRHPAILLLLLLASAGASAQAQQDPRDETPSADAVAAGEEAANGLDSDPQPRADDTRAADDYEASEQISEDLSVSFPVDI